MARTEAREDLFHHQKSISFLSCSALFSTSHVSLGKPPVIMAHPMVYHVMAYPSINGQWIGQRENRQGTIDFLITYL